MANDNKALTTQKNDLNRFLIQNAKQIAAALPVTVARFLTPERIIKILMVAVSRTPKLLQVEKGMLLRAVMDIAQLGLEPNSPLGHAYLVPFKNNKRGGIMEVNAIIGYRGFVELAWRSGRIESIAARCAYAQDKVHVVLGDDERIEHEPCLTGDRGDLVLVYSIAKFQGGGIARDFMTVGDVEKIRARSKAGTDGPWVTDYDEMAKKTIIRRARKLWPSSTELDMAAALDERAERGEYQPGDVTEGVIDMSFAEATEDAGDDAEATRALPPAKTDQVLEQLTSQQAKADEWAHVGPPPLGQPGAPQIGDRK